MIPPIYHICEAPLPPLKQGHLLFHPPKANGSASEGLPHFFRFVSVSDGTTTRDLVLDPIWWQVYQESCIFTRLPAGTLKIESEAAQVSSGHFFWWWIWREWWWFRNPSHLGWLKPTTKQPEHVMAVRGNTQSLFWSIHLCFQIICRWIYVNLHKRELQTKLYFNLLVPFAA